MKIIYSMYRADDIELAASGLPNPICFEEEVQFIQVQDQQVLPHVSRGWLRVFTHSLDVN